MNLPRAQVSEYEAVHPMRNWTDLRKRVGAYRRCFIFTHSCLPKEPIVVLHTFLTNQISKSMNSIVQVQRKASLGKHLHCTDPEEGLPR